MPGRVTGTVPISREGVDNDAKPLLICAARDKQNPRVTASV